MRNPSLLVTEKKKSSSCSSSSGKIGLKRGPWTAEEDELLTKCISKEGEGKWRTLPERAGLARCGKSCRLRWMNYLRPYVKRGQIAPDEEDLILRLHRLLGNRWSLIAGRIPGRTDNEIKNYWNTHLSKKLISQGIDPKTHRPLLDTSAATTATAKSLVAAIDGRKSESDNSGSSKMVTATTPTSSGQNPNLHQHHSGSVVDGFDDDQMVTHVGCDETGASDVNQTGCYYSADQYYQSNLDSEDGADAGGYNVNLQQSSKGVRNQLDGINCEGMVEDDGVFSSFLNSLINDDLFV